MYTKPRNLSAPLFIFIPLITMEEMSFHLDQSPPLGWVLWTPFLLTCHPLESQHYTKGASTKGQAAQGVNLPIIWLLSHILYRIKLIFSLE